MMDANQVKTLCTYADRLMDEQWRVNDEEPGWLWRGDENLSVPMEVWWIFCGFRSGLGEACLRMQSWPSL